MVLENHVTGPWTIMCALMSEIEKVFFRIIMKTAVKRKGVDWRSQEIATLQLMRDFILLQRVSRTHLPRKCVSQ